MVKKAWIALVRFGFRLLYQELAWTYDLVSWVVSLGEWRHWQAAALPFVQGPAILEIGHGPGHLLVALQKAGHTVFGVDLSPQMGRQAQRRLHKQFLAANLVRARVQALPFQPGSIDTILSTFPTEYIVDPDTLTAVYQLLGENGRFIVVPEGHLTGQRRLHRFIDWLFRITGQRDGAFEVDEAKNWPHPELWEPFRQRFADAGFSLQIKQVQRTRSIVTLFIASKKAPL